MTKGILYVRGRLRLPEAKQQRGEEGERERKREKTKKSSRKFARCGCREQLLGLGWFFFPFLPCILGPFRRRGISRALCCAAPQIQREGGFVASLVPYFAFKIFKAPQKALRGSSKVWKASAIMLF